MNVGRYLCVLFVFILVAVLAGCFETSLFDPWSSETCGDHGRVVEGPDGSHCECDEGYHADGYWCVSDGGDGDGDADSDGDGDGDGDGTRW